MTPDEKIEQIMHANRRLEQRLAVLEKTKRRHRLLWISIAAALPLGLWAATTIPNTFNDGETLSAAKLNANFQALAAAGDATPVGTIVAFAGSTAPTGWLLCNGAQVSRTTYSNLYAVTANAYGSGDGSSTFHLPDFRGRFLRGVDGTAGIDPDKATRTAMNAGGNTGNLVGSVQADAFQGHWHQFVDENVGFTGGGWSKGANIANGATHTDTVRNAITDGVNGTPRTTAETRPVNAYVNFIIKY